MRTLTYLTPPEDDGRQIKRIVRSQMSLSHHQLGALKEQGGILLDGSPVHANQIVRAGQRVELVFREGAGSEAAWDAGQVDIVYEDEDLIVINKEAPLACQSSSRQPENTLENRLAYRYRDEGLIFRPVNRLDKGTSGLMLAAKHPHAQKLLQEQLHTPDFVREYLAVVEGAPDPAEGVIDASIRKCEGATVRREVHPSGKNCITRYRTEAGDGTTSVVRLRLNTGRTHQIRVHLSYLGCPVLGDFLYGREDDRLPGRFALHSAYVSFIHPISRERMSFQAPLPFEIMKIICIL